jgi:tetratricopeptide (TPR) repeat protein
MPESPRDEIAKLEALYANNPEGRVFTHLAEAYRKAGDLDRARGILEQGLTRHEGYASAHVVLGRVLMDQQNSEEASVAFRRVLSLDPHNHVALRSLGDIARAAGDNDKALHYFEELRSLDPNNDELGDIIEQLRSEPSASATATAAIEEPEPVTAEPEPEPEIAPAVAAAPEPVTEEVPDLGFEWSAEESEEGLPGDLASLADMSAESAAEPEAEVPSFEDIDFGDLNTSAAPVEEPLQSDNPFAFEGLATSEEPIASDDPFGFEESVTFEESAALEEPVALDEPVTHIEVDVDSPVSPSAAVIADAAEPVVSGDFADVDIDSSGEVVTETIAELYTSQGLHDRAADVYRELLRQRPDDSELQMKLNEAESLAREPQPMPLPMVEEPFEHAPEPEWLKQPEAESEVEPEPEPWLASAGDVPESPPTPYAWAEQTNEASMESGPPVTDYFQRLLGWKPISTDRATVTASPTATGGPEGEREPEIEMLLEEPAAQLEPSEPPASEPMPWKPESAAAPLTSTSTSSEASTSTTSEDAFDEWFGAPEPQPENAAPAAAESSAEPGDGDDDDLEMFRSWLQSLKK